MKMLDLSKPLDGEPLANQTDIDDLLAAQERIRNEDIVVFRTNLHTQHRDYVFETTTKDIHLNLGRLTQKEQHVLAMIVSSRDEGDGIMLINPDRTKHLIAHVSNFKPSLDKEKPVRINLYYAH